MLMLQRSVLDSYEVIIIDQGHTILHLGMQ